MNNHDKMYCHRKFYGTRASVEMLKEYILTCWRGTCSSIGKLKGYMARKRLRTPVLEPELPCAIKYFLKIIDTGLNAFWSNGFL